MCDITLKKINTIVRIVNLLITLFASIASMVMYGFVLHIYIKTGDRILIAVASTCLTISMIIFLVTSVILTISYIFSHDIT